MTPDKPTPSSAERMFRVEETTAMGETWWNVVFADAPKDYDDRHVVGSFTKGREHAESFARWMNGDQSSHVAEAAAKIESLREYADARCLLDFDRELDEILAMLKEGTK